MLLRSQICVIIMLQTAACLFLTLKVRFGFALCYSGYERIAFNRIAGAARTCADLKLGHFVMNLNFTLL